MARRKAKVTSKNQNLTRLRLGRATTQAFDASRAKLRAAVMSSEPGVYSAAQLWDDSWWVEAVDKFVAPVLWDAYMRSAFESLPENAESIPPWVFRSAEVSWRAQVNRVRHLGVTVGNRVAVLADTGEGESKGWMLEKLGLVAAAGPLSEGIEDGVVLTEGDAADQGGLSAGAELQQGFKTWVAAGANSRPTHQDADGQTVGFDELFVVGGEECEFPGDPALSDAEAINCECETDYSMEEPPEVELPDDWSVMSMNAMTGEVPGVELTEEQKLQAYLDKRQAQRDILSNPSKVLDALRSGDLQRIKDVVATDLRQSTSWAKLRNLDSGLDVPLANTGRAGAAQRVQAALDEALTAIDGVHGVPEGNKAISYHLSPSSTSEMGSFNVKRGDDMYIAIRETEAQANIILHETGHYLDYTDLGTPLGSQGTGSFGLNFNTGQIGLSGQSSVMEGAISALYETPEIQNMVGMYQEIVANGQITLDGKLYGQSMRDTLEYLLRPEEVWARAYAQFIALESGSPTLIADLAAVSHSQESLGLVFKWGDSFSQVQGPMREVFRLAGVA